MLHRRSIFPAIALTVLGCNSGGGGGSPQAPSSPVSDAQISSLQPQDGQEDVAQDTVVKATFSKSMDPASIHPATFVLFFGSPGGNQVAGTTHYDPVTRTASFQPSEKLVPGGGYVATLSEKIQDEEGMPIASSLSWQFKTFDDKAPEILFVSPGCGTKALPAETFFCIGFSEPINPATLNGNTLFLTKKIDLVPGGTPTIQTGATPSVGTPTGSSFESQSAGGTIALPADIEIAADGQSACIYATSFLEGNTTYKLSVTKGVEDLKGNALVSPFSCTFETYETVPPFVEAKSPLPGATDVPVATKITAKFSEPVLGVTPETFYLQKNPVTETSPKIAAAFQYDEDTQTATLTPSAKLAFFSSYTATVSKEGIADLVGNPMAADESWSFSTPTGWQDPTLLETDDFASATDIRVATNTVNKSVWAIWLQNQNQSGGDTYVNLYAREYVPDQGWQPQIRLTDNGFVSTGIAATAFSASSPQIAIDIQGNAFVAWVQRAIDNSQTPPVVDKNANAYVRFLPHGSASWTPAYRVSTDHDTTAAANAVSEPRIGLDDANGEHRLAWIQKAVGDSKKCVYTSVYDPNTELWSSPVRVNSDLTTDVPSLQIAGTSIVTWTQKPTGELKTSLYWSAKDPLASPEAWTAQAKVNTDTAADVITPSLAFEPGNGNVHAIWMQFSGTLIDIHWNVFSASTGQWNPSQLNVSESESLFSQTGFPSIAANRATGKIYLAFLQTPPGSLTTGVHVRETSDSGATWSPKTLVSAAGSLCTSPILGMDEVSGSAYAAWNQAGKFFSNQYLDAASGWEAQPKDAGAAADKPAALAAFHLNGVYHTLAVFLRTAAGKDSVWSNLLQQ